MKYPKLINLLRKIQINKKIYFEINNKDFNVKNINLICFNINNLLYDNYNIIDKSNINNIDEFEDCIINNTINYIINIINKYKNCHYFLSLDGIPPYQKITQQRIKRFNIYYKNKNNINNIWETTYNILPGTNFIKKVNNKFISFINNYNKSNNNNNIHYSFNKDGESIHKINQYIKKFFNNNNINNIIIYGYESELIILLLINILNNNNNNIFINYSIDYLNKKGFYDIKQLYKLFLAIFNNNVNKIYNFIVLYLLINFYQLQIPLFDNINLLINLINNFNDKLLFKNNNDYIINNKALLNLLNLLSNKELELFKNYNNLMNKKYFNNLINMYYINVNNNKNNSNNNNNKIINYNEKVIKNLNIINEIRIKQKDYDKFNNINFQNNNNNINDIFNIYKNNYYEFYNIKSINSLCENYFYGFYWLINYYFNCKLDKNYNASCPDKYWYYKYYCLPFISSLYDYYNYNLNKYNDVNFINSNNNNQILYEHQLIYIIPLEHLKNINNDLYEKILNNNNNKLNVNLNNIKIDTLHKIFYSDCNYLIPLIDFNVVKNILK